MTALPTYVGSGAAAGGTGNVTARADVSGSVPGDLLILAVQSSNEAATAPSGWLEVTDSPQGVGTPNSAGATRLTLFWRWADRATVNGQANPVVTDTGNHTQTVCYAFRGVNTNGDPWDVTSGGTEGNSDTSLSATGDTTTRDNCLVAVFIANSIDLNTTDNLSSPANSDLGSVTSRAFAQTTSGSGGGINLITGTKATAGTFGATTATFANNSNYAFISVALRPSLSPWLQSKTTDATNAGGTGNAGIAWPSHQTDDIGLVIVETAGGEAVATPSGFTSLPSSPQSTGTGTNGTRLSVFYRRATSGAESNANFTDPGDHWHGFMLVIRGCATSGSPVNIDSGGVKASADTSVSIGGATTTVSDCLILAVCSRDNLQASPEFSGWTNANLEALVEVWDNGVTFGNGGGLGVASGTLHTAGATGTTTASTTNSVVNAYMTIALKSGDSVSTVFPRVWATIL